MERSKLISLFLFLEQNLLLLLDLSTDKLVIECGFHYGEKLIFIDQIKGQVGEKETN